MFFFLCLLQAPLRGVRSRALSSEYILTKLILHIGCPSYQLTSQRKLALIQKSSAQTPKALRKLLILFPEKNGYFQSKGNERKYNLHPFLRLRNSCNQLVNGKCLFKVNNICNRTPKGAVLVSLLSILNSYVFSCCQNQFTFNKQVNVFKDARLDGICYGDDFYKSSKL